MSKVSSFSLISTGTWNVLKLLSRKKTSTYTRESMGGAMASEEEEGRDERRRWWWCGGTCDILGECV
jgi:hypothetical protein